MITSMQNTVPLKTPPDTVKKDDLNIDPLEATTLDNFIMSASSLLSSLDNNTHQLLPSTNQNSAIIPVESQLFLQSPIQQQQQQQQNGTGTAPGTGAIETRQEQNNNDVTPLRIKSITTAMTYHDSEASPYNTTTSITNQFQKPKAISTSKSTSTSTKGKLTNELRSQIDETFSFGKIESFDTQLQNLTEFIKIDSNQLPFQLQVGNLPKVSRVENQMNINLKLSPTISTSSSSSSPFLKENLLYLPTNTIAKEKFYLQKPLNQYPQDIIEKLLHLEAFVVSIENNTNTFKQIYVCDRCVKREQRRASRRKSGLCDNLLWCQDSNKSVLIFNNKQIIPLIEEENNDSNDSTKQFELSSRIVCYCRHHKSPFGFKILFLIKNFKNEIIAKALTDSIMIIDKKSNSSEELWLNGNNELSVPSDSDIISNFAHPSSYSTINPLNLNHNKTSSFGNNNSDTNNLSMNTYLDNHPYQPTTTNSSSSSSSQILNINMATNNNKIYTNNNNNTMLFPSPNSVSEASSEVNSSTYHNSQPPPPPHQYHQYPHHHHHHHQRKFSTQSSISSINETAPAFSFSSSSISMNNNIDRNMNINNNNNNNVTNFVTNKRVRHNIDDDQFPQQYQQQQQQQMQMQMQMQVQQAHQQNPLTTLYPKTPSFAHLSAEFIHPSFVNQPIVQRIIPSQGSINGGIEITILGSKFKQGQIIKFGENIALSSQCWNETTMVTYLPPSSVAGQVYVTVLNSNNNNNNNNNGNTTNENHLEIPQNYKGVFTYIDDTDKQLIELALQIVGLKMTGKLEDAKNIAKRIIGQENSKFITPQSQPSSSSTSSSSCSSSWCFSDSIYQNKESYEGILCSIIKKSDSSYNLSIRDNVGRTLLHLASHKGYFHLCSNLIYKGARIDSRDSFGFTPLHYACISGNIKIIELLMKCNVADINSKICNGLTARDLFMKNHIHTTEPSNILSLDDIEYILDLFEKYEDGNVISQRNDSNSSFQSSLGLIDYPNNDIITYQNSQSLQRTSNLSSSNEKEHGYEQDNDSLSLLDHDDDNISVIDLIAANNTVNNNNNNNNNNNTLWNRMIHRFNDRELPKYEDLFPNGNLFWDSTNKQSKTSNENVPTLPINNSIIISNNTLTSCQSLTDDIDSPSNDEADDIELFTKSINNFFEHKRRSLKNDKMLLFFWIPLMAVLLSWLFLYSISSNDTIIPRISTMIPKYLRNSLAKIVLGNQRMQSALKEQISNFQTTTRVFQNGIGA
ncbi:Spt23p NDAI_0C00180 [Naumovozyma dairenensis CBS 421]|uniref:IPT/TIG domain-containing protein n=1 Tax=Naumovozyma dairenensis (strain ATCC 10597 / BCRC 20456 / CBS 421 / NBRC 0211 / NRRL Y-12639) TaxID=1071378 RepID=G0W7B8_NAUDC|nr:hypothetical protein NDAI_0C00180 [Naumovozyma dairenensis CBS 421]CCD23679.1 hypothetical protein NDAI_0C00180 [Naumovozyma dairenensis CBS 421]